MSSKYLQRISIKFDSQNALKFNHNALKQFHCYTLQLCTFDFKWLGNHVFQKHVFQANYLQVWCSSVQWNKPNNKHDNPCSHMVCDKNELWVFTFYFYEKWNSGNRRFGERGETVLKYSWLRQKEHLNGFKFQRLI